MQYIHLPIVAEWLCFISAILLLKHTDKYWHTLRFYLGFVAYTETLAYYIVKYNKCSSNDWLYNFFIIIEYAYGIWLFSNLISLKVIKKVSIIGYLLFCAGYMNIYLKNNNEVIGFFDSADIIGSEIMLVLCMLYYYSIFKEDRYVNLLQEPLFWFVSGCFIFYATSIGVETFFKNLVDTTRIHSISLRYIILQILNPVLYGSWIKAFLCMKRKRTSTQQL